MKFPRLPRYKESMQAELKPVEAKVGDLDDLEVEDVEAAAEGDAPELEPVGSIYILATFVRKTTTLRRQSPKL